MSLEDNYRKIIQDIGEDPNREGLKKTPERAAKAIKHFTKGYHQNLDSIINDALFDSDIDDIVIMKDIELYSLCEHHLVPFIGKCHVGYIPAGKILGISKISRIIDHFSKRLQVQERLTQQIANTIMDVTKASGVGIIIEAKHLCMMMRGIEKQHSTMTTAVMLGSLRDQPSKRLEFINLIRNSS